MKNINEFLLESIEKPLVAEEVIIDEGRRKKDDDENIDMSTTTSSKPDKTKGKEELNKYKKKDAENNDSRGLFGIAEPVDNEAVDAIDLNSPDNTDSMDDLIDKFDAEEDFFIIGEAGWGKTTVIENLAAKYHRTVITVYLDKAVASDLGGIPVPVQGKRGGAEQEMAMPKWAAIMKNNPDVQFLLFFDEMNQAAPDVQNALMPIVLKHNICGWQFDNFFVGAAGNYEHENSAVSALSGPLKSRFKPIITWETGDERSWKSAFNYLHQKWDKKLSKDIVDVLEENASLFDNPREIEHKVLKYIESIKNGEGKGRSKPEKILRRLKNLAKEELSRSQEKQLTELAEKVFEYITDAQKQEEEGGRAGRKNREMVPEPILDAIKQGMMNGYIKIVGDPHKYGCSRENIRSIIDEDDCNAEMLERVISKFEADGIKFKYDKDSEWKKAGYTDPTSTDFMITKKIDLDDEASSEKKDERPED